MSIGNATIARALADIPRKELHAIVHKDRYDFCTCVACPYCGNGRRAHEACCPKCAEAELKRRFA